MQRDAKLAQQEAAQQAADRQHEMFRQAEARALLQRRQEAERLRAETERQEREVAEQERVRREAQQRAEELRRRDQEAARQVEEGRQRRRAEEQRQREREIAMSEAAETSRLEEQRRLRQEEEDRQRQAEEERRRRQLASIERIREVRALVREKGRLDVDILNRRSPLPFEQTRTLIMCARSDELYARIISIINAWDEQGFVEAELSVVRSLQEGFAQIPEGNRLWNGRTPRARGWHDQDV